jgi:uncharacterized protein (DUF433 family)
MGNETVLAAFSEAHAERLTGVRKLQLRYWDHTEFFSPSYSQGQYREAFGRVYSFSDIVALRVLAALRNKHGVSVQHLRQVKLNLSKESPNLWTGVRLYVRNKRVHWVEPGTGLPQDIASGQFVFQTIDLDSVVASTKSDVKAFNARKSGSVGKIEKIKSLNHSAPVIAGTRIPVQTIKRFHEAGYSTEQIISEYPDLTVKDVKAALSFEKAA